MRILVVGAAAIGGYFGGRLLQAGRDVTFLVRPKRAAALAQTGLVLRSRFGDVVLADPPLVGAETLTQKFDLVLLSCKAYDLDGAMDSFAAAVGPETTILPLLNGMRHLESLAARFGGKKILGGFCLISATLGDDGAIMHLNDMHGLTFGELDGARTPRTEAVAKELLGAGFDAVLSQHIRLEMWEKFVFIATLAGACCLMRASIGDMVAAGAADVPLRLLDECAAIASTQNFAARPDFLERTRKVLTAPDSPMMASMLRDIERGAPVEGDQILGDMLARAGAGQDPALLRLAFAHVKAYAARRARESARRATGNA